MADQHLGPSANKKPRIESPAFSNPGQPFSNELHDVDASFDDALTFINEQLGNSDALSYHPSDDVTQQSSESATIGDILFQQPSRPSVPLSFNVTGNINDREYDIAQQIPIQMTTRPRSITINMRQEERGQASFAHPSSTNEFPDIMLNPSDSDIHRQQEVSSPSGVNIALNSPGIPTERKTSRCTLDIAEPDRKKLIQQQLVLLLHAHKCKRRGQTISVPECTLPYCRTMKNVLNHMTACNKGKSCKVDHCASSRQIITHWKNCQQHDCAVCAQLKRNDRAANQSSTTTTAVNTVHQSGSQLTINAPHQAPMINNASDLEYPLAVTHKKEWHIQMTNDLRKHLMQKIVQAIFPNPDEVSRQDPRMKNLIAYARNFEGNVFETASNRGQYYHLIAEKIYKVQKELEEKRIERMKKQNAQSQEDQASRDQLKHKTQSGLGPSQKDDEDKTCVICLDNERGVIFLPCKHVVTCKNCAVNVTKCPFCRQNIGFRLDVDRNDGRWRVANVYD